ncbi:MAG TPA: Ig-like domain-containing protein, partial [Sphingobium sp.]
MDFERDWNVDAAADRQQAQDPELAALAARVKAVHHAQPGTMRTIAPNAQGVVVLPAGTNINQIEVDGRNLIVTLPDGTQMVILDGAVVMPHIVVGDVEIPSVNLAALLIGEEPQPAAGPARSSGGNFLAADGAIGDPFALGDLLPPTELQFTQPEEREILPIAPDEDNEPELQVPTSGAGTEVDEAGLGTENRPGESPGSNAPAPIETTSGVISYVALDAPATVTINGVVITSVGQTITGTSGTLTIVSITSDSIGYSYTVTDNTSGDDVTDNFIVTVTDVDGDSVTDTLVLHVIDDVPTANDDSAQQQGENAPVTINAFSNDIFGADGVDIDNNPTTRVTIVSGPAEGSVAYDPATGLFTFTPAPGQEGTASFVYQIVDGDGDADTATVTITLQPDSEPTVEVAAESDTVVDEAALNPNGTAAESTAEVASGTLAITTGNDAIAKLVVGGVDVTNGGVVAGAFGTLTVTGSPADGYAYSYELTTNTLGDDTQDSFTVTVTDSDGDPANSTLTIDIIDDEPVANDDPGYVAPEDTPITIDALHNDIFGADGVDKDNNPLIKVSIVTGPQHGSASYDPATGLFTYSPHTVAVETTDSFTYKIVDGDGDEDTATVTILLTPDTTPNILSVASVTVDEDGLKGANVDASRPGEIAYSGSAMANGQIVVDFGNDVPTQGNALASIQLIDSDALDGQLQTVAGGSVTFALEGGTGDLVGSDSFGEVIRIHITSATVGAGLDVTKITYSYTVTLTHPVEHTVAGSEDSDLLSGVGFKVTDTDNSNAQGSFNVTVGDDIPVAAVAGTGVPTLVLDESRPLTSDTNGATLPGGRATVTANFSNSFTAVSYGTDGAGSVSYALALSGEGIGSGLFALGADGGKGAEILLYNDGETIVGRTSADDSNYFTIAVDGA